MVAAVAEEATDKAAVHLELRAQGRAALADRAAECAKAAVPAAVVRTFPR